jgi:hypothetical protein
MLMIAWVDDWSPVMSSMRVLHQFMMLTRQLRSDEVSLQTSNAPTCSYLPLGEYSVIVVAGFVMQPSLSVAIMMKAGGLSAGIS